MRMAAENPDKMFLFIMDFKEYLMPMYLVN